MFYAVYKCSPLLFKPWMSVYTLDFQMAIERVTGYRLNMNTKSITIPCASGENSKLF